MTNIELDPDDRYRCDADGCEDRGIWRIDDSEHLCDNHLEIRYPEESHP